MIIIAEIKLNEEIVSRIREWAYSLHEARRPFLARELEIELKLRLVEYSSEQRWEIGGIYIPLPRPLGEWMKENFPEAFI